MEATPVASLQTLEKQFTAQLQHKATERAVMVEIDAEVIRLAKEFLPSIAGDAWSDRRAEVIVGDGVSYVAQAPSGGFDVIIVDSTDPVGVGEVLFTERFYRDCARVLTSQGIIVNQCGVPFMQADELRETSLRRARIFNYVSAYVAAVPTYVGGFMTLGFATNGEHPRRLTAEMVTNRGRKAGILGTTQYWSPDIHVSAFNLPPYIAKHLCLAGS